MIERRRVRCATNSQPRHFKVVTPVSPVMVKEEEIFGARDAGSDKLRIKRAQNVGSIEL